MRRLSLLIALLAACSSSRLQGGQGQFVAPASFDFGNVFVGATPQRPLTLANPGNAPLSITAAASGDPQVWIASSTSLSLAEGGSSTLTLALSALHPGPVSATLSFTGDATATVQVTANVIPDLACPESAPCNVQTFDPNRGACVGSPSPDGTACNDGNQCETGETCLGGVCKGQPKSCDDQDVCTTDYCTASAGCQHLDNGATCNGSDPCQIYYCDPVKGCQSAPAADGTPCAAVEQCVQANVCLHGVCTGTPLPDGTRCVPPKDPCAKDGLCKSGQCDSPTAQALVPGDILWKTVASELSDGDGGEISWEPGDGGLVPGWRAAAAVDDLGNLYLDDDDFDGGGSLVSLDVCGHERWRTDQWGTSSFQWTNGRHLLTNGIVITVAADQSFLAQSAVTGQLLWRYDLTQAGINVSALQNFTIEDIALSNDGIFYFTAQWTAPDGDGGTQTYPLVGGLLANGQTKFTTLEPPVEGTPWFGYPLLVDGNEDLYTTLNLPGDSALIESFDQTGALRWSLPVARGGLQSLSDDQGFFLEPVSLTAFTASGQIVWADTEPAAAVQPTGHSPVVLEDGTEIVTRRRIPGDGGVPYGSVESFEGNGTPGWAFALSPGEFPISSHVLDQQGLLYFATTQKRLVALDGQSGAVAWQLALPSEGPMYNGVLSITPAGSLIVSARRELFSVYGGAPMATSPWPRFRGDNGNRSSPEPQAPGTPP